MSRGAVKLLLIVIVLAKLVLVRGHDIALWETPHDDFWHILSGQSWYWGRPYNEWTLMHLPVYPLFIKLVQLTGLPLRVAIELTYLGGAAAVALSLTRVGLPRWIIPIVFAVIAFHPHSFHVFDFARAETLHACLMLFMVAAFINVAAADTWQRFVGASLALAATTALAWNCRKESAVFGAAFGLIVVALAAMAMFRMLRRRDAIRLAIALVVTPVAASLLLGMAIATLNGIRYGLWATNELAAPNFVRAIKTLQEIAPPHPIWQVTATREVRAMAYAASPAFRELQPILDGQPERWFTTTTREFMGLDREIGAGWFHWALIWAAAEAGHFKSASDAELFFDRVANELSAALGDGRLPKRSVVLPYVDPAFDLWLPHLGPALIGISRSVLMPPVVDDLKDQPGIGVEIVQTFNTVANRRHRDVARYGSVKRWIARWHATALTLLAGLAVLSIFVPKSGQVSSPAPALLALVFISALIALRIVFFAIIHASAWNGAQPRYLFGASILVTVIVGVAAAVLRALSRSTASISRPGSAEALP